MKQIETFNVPLASKRLDQFLVGASPAYSRSYFQTLIKQGNVHVNGVCITKASAPLKEHDQVECCFPTPPPLSEQAAFVEFETVDVQEDFLIINKPAGLLVHKAATVPGEKTLVGGLLHSFREFKEFNDYDRPGIVHRLDKKTSGLMIVARKQSSQSSFARMFKDRTIEKTYLALVEGRTLPTGRINFPIGRDPFNPTKMSQRGINARQALSSYRVLAYYKNHTLLEVKIMTGRTHQIRVHCAAIGHSIVGDTVYGKKSLLIDRQALHAWKISFTYNGSLYSYFRPVPTDFALLLGLVRNSA